MVLLCKRREKTKKQQEATSAVVAKTNEDIHKTLLRNCVDKALSSPSSQSIEMKDVNDNNNGQQGSETKIDVTFEEDASVDVIAESKLIADDLDEVLNDIANGANK